jgi:hypothetical protein
VLFAYSRPFSPAAVREWLAGLRGRRLAGQGAQRGC